MPGKYPETITPVKLREVSSVLRLPARALTSLANAMEDREMEEVEVLGMKMTRRGLDGISALVKSCRKNIGEI